MSYMRYGHELKFFHNINSEIYAYGTLDTKSNNHFIIHDPLNDVNDENIINLIGKLLIRFINREMPVEKTFYHGKEQIRTPDYKFVYEIIQELSTRLGTNLNLKDFNTSFADELEYMQWKLEELQTEENEG